MRLLTPDVLNYVRNSIVYAIYQWNDPNRNNNYDTGEINLDPHGPDFVEQTGMEFDDLPPNFVDNPTRGNRRPMSSGRFARTGADPNLAIRVTGLYLPLGRHLPGPESPATLRVLQHSDHEAGPGRRWRLGTGDDGGLVTYYEYPEALAGAG